MSRVKYRGVIFDLDGTLVDSRLDFAAMRRELGFADGQPLLETLAALPCAEKRKAGQAIILRHEVEGALRATPMPGADALLRRLAAHGLKTGIFTRNARHVTELTLQRLALAVDDVVAREDAPAKPDPAGLLALCARWGAAPAEVLYVGDYLFDLEAGRNAGIRTLLYLPQAADFAHDAAEVITELEQVLAYLD